MECTFDWLACRPKPPCAAPTPCPLLCRPFTHRCLLLYLLHISISTTELSTAPSPHTLPPMSASAQVGSILNFSLMYFLAPVASAAAAGSSLGLLQKITGPYFLSKWGAPAGHFFQPGFPASKRLVNFLYKVQG